MEKLAQLIIENTINGKVDKVLAVELLKQLKLNSSILSQKDDIAIIGMAIRTSEARNIKEYWDNIICKKDSIKKFPDTRKMDMEDFLNRAFPYKKKEYSDGGYLDEIDKFDYKFFKISPSEANLMSPNQRLFLETAWEAIEDSGYGGDKLSGSQTGVYLGYSSDELYDYKRFLTELNPECITEAMIGNLSSIIPSRISYLLDLKGPSIVLDTACSSSLTAVHYACKGINSGECKMALVGGVRTNILRLKGEVELGVQSRDDRARAFDDDASGTSAGEGVAAIVLKPLRKAVEDGDYVYAVIKGSAINQDGNSNGITAPNMLAQEKVILDAWKDADIDPKTISYIEAHGTGTKLGDPIELGGIQKAFKKYTEKKQFCGIGTVKTNIGHLDSAAGIAGVIKSALALNNKIIPPSIHFNRPNRNISFEDSPIYFSDRVAKWDEKDVPRRCGVSAFGLSGTNCHIVMEGAPRYDNSSINKDSKKDYLFVVSAKSLEALNNLLRKYNCYLDSVNEIELEIGNLCYTASVGRGHYEYRIAFIVKNINDLKIKINQIINSNFKTNQIDGVYYGVHKIVTSAKINRDDTELTEEEINILDKSINDILSRYFVDGKDTKALLESIAEDYVRGAKVVWDKLYLDKKYKKIPLPTYAFDKKRCWLSIGNNKINGEKDGIAINRPMLSILRFDSYDEEVYSTIISVSDFWEIREHKIKNNFVLVGTAYLEMAIEAFMERRNTKDVEFSNVIFLNPLVLREEEERQVHIKLNKSDDGFRFSIVSRLLSENNEDNLWTLHVEGTIKENYNNIEITRDIDTIMNRCNREIIKPDYRKINETSYIEFGPRWRNIKEIFVGDNESLSRIELSKEYIEELKEYILYPALMDNSLASEKFIENSAYLPFGYKKVITYKSIPKTFYSHVRKIENSDNDAEVLAYNIDLIDENGKIILEIKEYVQKKVDENKVRGKALNYEENCFYSIGWINKTIKNKNISFNKENMLIIGHENKLGNVVFDMLKEKSINDIKSYEKDLDKIVKEVLDNNITKIIHMGTVNNEGVFGKYDDFDKECEKSIEYLFGLVKKLGLANIKSDIDIVLITSFANKITGSEKYINPSNAALLGLGKVINHEFSKIKCKCIDVDEFITANLILDEIESCDHTGVVGYRNGERFIEEFKEVYLDQLKDNEIKIKEKGVYIITGGTGGIGLEMAKYLSDQNQIKLILLNRTEMPSRDQWNNILLKDLDKKLCNQIKSIIGIESKGSSVEFYSVDVANEELLEKVFNEVRNKYGVINGIMHTSGIAGDGFIVNKDLDRFRSVLSPKVRGTWNINKLTWDDKLDFFVLFSAGTSLIGAAGQSDYTVANCYLDSFEAYRNSYGKRTQTINWSAWKDVGMAYNHSANVDGILKVLDTTQAINGFNTVFKKDIGRVTIGKINYEHDFWNQTDLLINVSNNIKAYIKKRNRSENYNIKNNNKVALLGRIDNKYSKTEQIIGNIFGDILGISEIDIYESFYELGGDSLSGMKIVRKINSTIDNKIDITHLFNNTSVNALSLLIDNMKINSLEQYSEHEGQIKVSIKDTEKKEEYYPLSFSQKRIYVLEQLYESKTSYNNTDVIEIAGDLDIQQLEKSLKTLIKRHETLRTTFEFVDGKPKQKINEVDNFKLQCIEINDNSMKEIIQTFIKPFELNKEVFRAQLVRVSLQRHILLIDIHHIVYDGASMHVLLNDLVKSYFGENLKELNIQYKDYVIWQNNLMNTEGMVAQKNYWINRLGGEIPVLTLPTDYDRPLVQSFEGDKIECELNAELIESINRVSVDSSSTLYTVLLSAYNILLYKYTGQEDLIVGSPVEGRNSLELDNLIGVFINILPMRNYVNYQYTFKEFLETVKINSFEAINNQDYPFDLLVETLDLPKDLSRGPIFSTMFALLNIGHKEFSNDNISFKSVPITNSTSKLDITLTAFEKGNMVELQLEYCTKLFKKERMKQFLKDYIKILNIITSNMNIKIKDINIMSDAERDRALESAYGKYNYNLSNKKNFSGKVYLDLFHEQVKMTPDKIALICGERSFSYKTINEQANKLARKLIDKGVTAETIIGIISERSENILIGILAIFKAGGAYLPIDPKLPSERKDYMLQDSGADLLLVTDNHHHNLNFKGEIIRIYEYDTNEYDSNNLNIEINGDSLAYVIYTSGSTGRPKGIMIEHDALVKFIEGVTNRVVLDENEVVLALTSISFDISILEILVPLTMGMKIILANDIQQIDINEISKLIVKEKVEVMQVTPSRLQLFIESGITKSAISQLRKILIGGEALSESLLSDITKLTEADIYNMYGPTESTVWCSAKKMNSKEKINLGKPIYNATMYVFDKDLNIQLTDVPGELYIGGNLLARGYINQRELTEEKFINNPFNNKERLYKSGDIVRRLKNGDIEYIGRKDYQIKIRGYRIELGEIENQIFKIDGIQNAIVIDRNNSKGEKYLCAYVILNKELTIVEIKSYLSEILPDYMIPQKFVKIDEIPLMVNGKIDRKKLEGFNKSMELGNEYKEASTVIEKELLNIWEIVLGIDQIGIEDSFFDLGGNSILIVQMHKLIDEKFPKTISIVDIFAYKTIRNIAEFIQRKSNNLNNSLQIKTLELPKEYFLETYLSNKEQRHKFQQLEIKINLETLNKINELSSKENIKPFEFLAGIFIFTISQVLERNSIALQVMNNGKKVLPFEVDLGQVNDFTSLFDLLQSGFEEKKSNNLVNIEDMLTLIKSNNDIEVGLIFAEGKVDSREILRVFDILVNLRSDYLNITIVCEFDSYKIKHEKMECMMSSFASIIKAYVDSN